MAELEGFAVDYRRRLGGLESELDQLRGQRDAVIRRVHKAGVPIVEIADVLGLSHQRVSKIVR
jgi:hypothetical protein